MICGASRRGSAGRGSSFRTGTTPTVSVTSRPTLRSASLPSGEREIGSGASLHLDPSLSLTARVAQTASPARSKSRFPSRFPMIPPNDFRPRSLYRAILPASLCFSLHICLAMFLAFLTTISRHRLHALRSHVRLSVALTPRCHTSHSSPSLSYALSYISPRSSTSLLLRHLYLFVKCSPVFTSLCRFYISSFRGYHPSCRHDHRVHNLLCATRHHRVYCVDHTLLCLNVHCSDVQHYPEYSKITQLFHGGTIHCFVFVFVSMHERY